MMNWPLASRGASLADAARNLACLHIWARTSAGSSQKMCPHMGMTEAELRARLDRLEMKLDLVLKLLASKH